MFARFEAGVVLGSERCEHIELCGGCLLVVAGSEVGVDRSTNRRAARIIQTPCRSPQPQCYKLKQTERTEAT